MLHTEALKVHAEGHMQCYEGVKLQAGLQRRDKQTLASCCDACWHRVWRAGLHAGLFRLANAMHAMERIKSTRCMLKAGTLRLRGSRQAQQRLHARA